MNKLLLAFLFFVITGVVKAQTCNTIGQTPSSAFPVCGTKKFSQSTVPYCGGTPIPGPCGSDPLTDMNPFWYRFTCYTGGTLGFTITPNDLGDDYDWQLFDITGKNPNDVFTDRSLFVACNWSGNPGKTGTSSAGTSLQNCAGYAYPTFSAMPVLTEGHTYILLLSHFTRFNPSQNGYSLEFNGGSAVITDPLTPSLKKAEPKCDRTQVVVSINKKIRCNTIAADGSDFTLSPATANIIKVEGYGCSSGFDSDSLLITFDSPIPPGNYSIISKKGSDNNSLLDFCDNELPIGNQQSFVITAPQPTHVDSIVPVKCAPEKLVLVFKRKIQCASIAADGSDFFVTGSYPVSVIAAKGQCNSEGNTDIIEVTLAQPLYTAGSFTILLKNGLDGNPIIDECGNVTPIGEGQSFSVKDTVSADFNYVINKGCKSDIVDYSHSGANAVNSWMWTFDNGGSTIQNPQVVYNTTGLKTTRLIVSNGFCSDTLQKSFTLAEKVKAIFSGPTILCPEDSAKFINNSLESTAWLWNFANGNTSTLKDPPAQIYPKTNSAKDYTISLIASDGVCADTAYRTMKVVKSCYIDVPTAFTPNNDGLNDFLYPLNAYKATDLEFKVYNRYGQLVFQTKDWTVKWDGTINGNLQPTGTYAWYLKYTNTDTGKKFLLKGTTVLIR